MLEMIKNAFRVKEIRNKILFTLFMLTWFPINIVSLFKKEVKWKHIGHNKSINIDDIVKSS